MKKLTEEPENFESRERGKKLFLKSNLLSLNKNPRDFKSNLMKEIFTSWKNEEKINIKNKGSMITEKLNP